MNALLKAHSREFEAYCSELMLWGATHNLTGYKSRADIMQNIVDSLAPLAFARDFKSALDIGSGCGFPAIPLAICKAECEFILLEPRGKRASFLSVIALNLGLKNVRVLKERIECVKALPQVDLITSRAFAESKKIIEISARFLHQNGYFLLYKSRAEGAESSDFGAQIAESKLDSATRTKIAESKIYYFYKSKSEALKWLKS